MKNKGNDLYSVSPDDTVLTLLQLFKNKKIGMKIFEKSSIFVGGAEFKLMHMDISEAIKKYNHLIEVDNSDDICYHGGASWDTSGFDFELSQIESSAKWLAGEGVSVWTNLLCVFSKSHRVRLASFGYDIIAATKTIKLSRKRIGSERCLLCGGNSVRPFDGDVDVKMSSGLTYKGQNNTGSIHPGCGGEFIAEGSNMRFAVRLRTRIYSPDGDKIEEYYE